MNQSLNTFSKGLLIIALVLGAVTYGLSFVIPATLISYSWWLILAFFFAITLLVHRFLLQRSAINPQKFINAFMLSTTVKLLLYLTIILIYVLLHRDDAVGFILTFFVYYMIFTFYEIISILKVLKKVQQESKS